LRRIAARAVPELRKAFAAGKLTLRQFELLSRLAPRQQRARVAAINRETEGAQIAAKVIDKILDGTKDDVRLNEISLAISQAVRAFAA
jgi:hypothetical protein